MKRTIFLIITACVLLIGGLLVLDAYLCNHAYYGLTLFSSFASCQGQGQGLDIMKHGSNRGLVLRGIVASMLPLVYLYMKRKNFSLRWFALTFLLGAVVYILGYTMMKDALFSPGALILIFNITLLCILLVFFLTSMALLGKMIFSRMQRKRSQTIHDIFLQFTLGLIVFCLFNVLLLQAGLYFGITIWIQIAALLYLIRQQRSILPDMRKTIESFISTIHNQLHALPRRNIFYYTLVVATILYVYMGLNLSYIPYPTAWDANHAYLFFPRAWSFHHGIYWGANTGGAAMPYLRYGFLTFWFSFAQYFPIGQGFFGISPDSLTILMNFWSGPLVLLATGFLLHTFLGYIADKKDHTGKEHNEEDNTKMSQSTLITLCIGWMLMLLWLTSGMGAFLIFVDNKTDLAVMFFSVIALYVGIQFIRALLTYKKNDHIPHQKRHLTQYAILAGIFFAAAMLAKPTGMFDAIHFGILFLLQRQVLLFGVGAYILIIGLLGKTHMLLIHQFISSAQATYLILFGLVVLARSLFRSRKLYPIRVYIRYFITWVATIVLALVLYKGPYSIIQQYHTTGTVKREQTFRTILLGASGVQQQKYYTIPSHTPVLLASTVAVQTLQAADKQAADQQITDQQATLPSSTPEQCIAQHENKDQLYTNVKPIVEAGNEDLGRYIGYGAKVFPRTGLFALLPQGCYSIYADARALCVQYGALQKATHTKALQDFLATIPKTPHVIDWENTLSLSGTDALVFKEVFKDIAKYMEENTLIKTADHVSIPYKFLVPFNVTFNRSLQNLSSYYTDIGIFSLMGFILVLIGLFYGLSTREKPLIIISLITLGAWATWRVVGSAIIRYSLGLILWTILGTIAYFFYLFQTYTKKIQTTDMVFLLLIAGSFAIFALIQLLLNMVRIASQGGGGPFVWYKSNVGQVDVFDNQLMGSKTTKIGYNATEVFDVQFPHYKPLLRAVNARKDGEGVIIAGTYAQYFMENQNNVIADGFLTRFWQNLSDNDVCKTYARLKDKNVKYIVIDPNIASVVMGEGNSTLLDRFLGIMSDDQQHITQYGTLTMLQTLVKQGYVDLFYTNNIVTKYAFVASDELLSKKLQTTGEALLVERAKMSSARYFEKAQVYGNTAAEIFVSRMNSFQALQDIADILGKDIREIELVALAKRIIPGVQQAQAAEIEEAIAALTNDEKFVLQQFIALSQAQKQDGTKFRQYVIGLIAQSINNGSQIIVFRVK